MSIQVSVYNDEGVQTVVSDAEGISWSTHYGAGGSGFGYLKYSLPRASGRRYPDIGFGYRVVVRKYLNLVLFDGQIRDITERTSPSGDKIEVTCLGHVTVAADDELYTVFMDTRLSRWEVVSEIPSGSFRPDRFVTGDNDRGIYLHPRNFEAIEAGDYTERVYTFKERDALWMSCVLNIALGTGTLFDGTVSSVSGADLVYANDSGEGYIAPGMIVFNGTQSSSATVDSVDTGTNTITVTAASDIAGWVNGDEIAVYGPAFWANIVSITDDTITYGGDELMGEDNLAADQVLINGARKDIAIISSVNVAADTITVTDEDALSGWEEGDVLFILNPYFSATFSSKSGVTITYSSPVGERVASQTTGWVLYNETRDECATVDSWNIASNQLDVTSLGDIAAWSASDKLRIYTPLRASILDGDDNVLWPSGDARLGSATRIGESISIAGASGSSSFKVRVTAYLAGSMTEAAFVMADSPKVYSTSGVATAATLASYVVDVLSEDGHGISPDKSDICSVSKTIEPMIYEFDLLSDAMTDACQRGDGQGNLLAWGLRLNADKKFFMERQTDRAVEYVVRVTGPVESGLAGDLQESWQQIRAYYTDKSGVQQVTEWVSNSDSYFGGRYRRKSVSLDNVDTEAEALDLARLYLEENRKPKTKADYSAANGAIFTPLGAPVPVEELRADGGKIRLEGWSAVGALGGTAAWSTEETIIGIEVSYDSGRARLIPASERSTFAEYMAELSRIRENA